MDLEPRFYLPVIAGRRAYGQKVLSTRRPNLLAYWPLWSASGPTAPDVSGAGRNGTHSNVTLGQPGIGDGRTAASYNGTTSYTNIYSASLAGAFNGAEGTLLVWAKVSGGGVWTDGTVRRLVYLGVDGNNQVDIQRPTDNNALRFIYKAGGTTKSAYVWSQTSTAFRALGLTWSASGDAVTVYLGGAQQGATLTGLGVWAGSLAATLSVLGAASTTPANVWSGSLAHVAVWNVALTAGEMAALARL